MIGDFRDEWALLCLLCWWFYDLLFGFCFSHVIDDFYDLPFALVMWLVISETNELYYASSIGDFTICCLPSALAMWLVISETNELYYASRIGDFLLFAVYLLL